MSHTLKTATIVPATHGIGESDFAAARKAIEAKTAGVVGEVFLDSVQTEGTIVAGDLLLDLDQLGLRYLGFGADPIITTPVAAPAAHEDSYPEVDEPAA